MKKIAIAAISALVSLLAFCQSEEFIKVGSVKITKEDSLKFSKNSGINCIYHGNFTSRIIAENPTKETITLETVLALGYHYRGGLSTITTITKLPANSSTEIALPIPLAVYGTATYMKFSTKDHNNRIITKNDIYWFNTELAYAKPWSAYILRTNNTTNTKSLYPPQVKYNRQDFLNIALSPSLNFVTLNNDYRNAVKKLNLILHDDNDNDYFPKFCTLNNRESEFSIYKNWQELAILDAIIISKTDSKHLPQEFLKILPNWIAAGGQLVLIGDCAIKGFENISDGRYGLGAIIRYKDKIDWADLIPRLNDTFAALCRVQTEEPKFPSDIAALEVINSLKNGTPFGSLIIILLIFSIIAGPVTIIVLARKNERLKLLWIFPLIATIFSILTIIIILCSKGISPSLYQYAYTVVDEKAGKVITAQNDIIVAPFELRAPLRYSANAVLSFANREFNIHKKGAEIFYNGEEFILNSKWIPSLWPATFSTITVRDLNSTPELNAAKPANDLVITNNLPLGIVTKPTNERLQKHTIKHIIEWRR